MKANALTSVVLFSMLASGWLMAAENQKPYKGSAEFERMKSLVGKWQGKTDTGEGPMEFTGEYRLISGGSAIEERIFAGTPKEMVTMYHDKKGKLSLTHYCTLGNRPGMLLKSSNDKTLEFDFDATCGVDDKAGMHMHSLSIKFDAADTITQNWKLFEDGKVKEDVHFILKRVKS